MGIFNLILKGQNAPTDVSVTITSIATEIPSSTVIGTLRGVDAKDRYLRYEIDNPKFYLEHSSTTRVQSTQLFRSSFGSLSGGINESVTVYVTNRFGSRFSKTFTVTVTGQSLQAPTSVTLSNVIMNVNAAPGDVLGTAAAIDPDDTTFTWALGGSERDLFTLSSTSGSNVQVIRSSVTFGTVPAFRTGFNPSTVLASTISFGEQLLSGTDHTSGFIFSSAAFLTARQPHLDCNADGLGDGIFDHKIVQLVGPNGSTTINALRLKMTSSNAGGSGVSQSNFRIMPGQVLTQLYYKYDFKMPSALSSTLLTDGVHNWMTISQWKTGGLYNSGDYFGGDLRNQLVLLRLGDGTFRWTFALDNNANDPDVSTYTIFASGISPTPTITSDAWYTVESYTIVHQTNGLIWWKINGTEVFRFEGDTIGQNNEPINRIHVHNNYSGGEYPITHHISNFEIYNSLPVSSTALQVGGSCVISLTATDNDGNFLTRTFPITLTGSGPPTEPPPTVNTDLDIDLTASSQYARVIRSTSGWYINQSALVHGLGTVVSTAANTARFRYSQNTLRGMLSEQQSTNYVPNPDMRGVVNGNIASNMVFESSFNASVQIASTIVGGFQALSGLDETTGFEWQAGEFFNIKAPAIQCIDDGLGLGIFDNKIVQIVGPNGSTTINALRLKMTGNNADETGISQDVLELEPGLPLIEFYYKIDVRLPSNMTAMLLTDGVHNWMTIGQYKTGGLYNSGDFFGGDWRNQLIVLRLGSGAFCWKMNIDRNANDPNVSNVILFSSSVTSSSITDGSWHTIEHYTKRSNLSDGVTWWKVNGVELFRFNGANYGPNNEPINRLFVAANYTGGVQASTSLHYANLEIWDGAPPSGSLPTGWSHTVDRGLVVAVQQASTVTNGVGRLRLAFSGAGGRARITPTPSPNFTRTVGQEAAASFRVMQVSGGLSGSQQIGVAGVEYDSSNDVLREDFSSFSLVASTFVTMSRQGLMLDSTADHAGGSLMLINLSTGVSVVVDVVLPQLEPQLSVTEPIMIGGQTRSRDNVQITGYGLHKTVYTTFQFNVSSQLNPVALVHLSDGTENNVIRLVVSTSMVLVAQVARDGIGVIRRELGPLVNANTATVAGFTFTSTTARFALAGQPAISTSFPAMTRVSTLLLGVGGTGITRTFAFSRVQLFVSTQSSAVFDAGVGATPETGAPPPTGAAFYVSASTGVDTNPGTLALPFLTPQKARDAMRTGSTKTTYFRQGRYQFTAPLDLTTADNGTKWYNYPGEKPIFSGGQRITGFTSDGSTTYSASITFDPGLDLVVGGVRYLISRSGTNSITGTWDPSENLRDSGWYFADVGTSSTNNLKFRSTDLTAGMFPAGSHPFVNIETSHHYRYQSSIQKITSIDFGTKVVSFNTPARDSLDNGSTYRLLGRPEWISRIREFGYAPERGKIIVRPHNVGTFEAEGVYCPRIYNILNISGSNIDVVGITFAETKSRLMAPSEHADGVHDEAAVRVAGTNNRIGGCFFKNVGEAISLQGAGHKIGGNRLGYLGGAGVVGNRFALASSVAIYANLIHDVGMAGGLGLYNDGVNLLNQGRNWRVAHNHIQDTARASIGGSSGAQNAYANNIFEYNKCIRANNATGDTGHIQSYAGDTGSDGIPRNYNQNVDCRFNWLEDAGGINNKTLTDGRYVWVYGFSFGGIYMDGLTSGWRVHGNFILHNNPDASNYCGMMPHGSNNVICTNNFTVFYPGNITNDHGFYSPWYSQPSSGIQTDTTCTYTRNISYTASLTASSPTSHVLRNTNTFPHCKPDPGNVTCNTNLVFRLALRAGETNSVVADPLFVNPAAKNFRLQPSSPAFGRGIQDLPWSLMGLINDTGGNAHLLDTANLSVYPDFWTGITALTQLKAIPAGRCEPVLSQNLPDE
jgi:hypothetical protein